nr:replication protein A 70 kDa DNA-binding subunit [Tanacetum cinerariifolium]
MAELHEKSNAAMGWKIDNEWWFTCYGVSSSYTDLGDCAWSCEHCAAMFWYGEWLKGYSKVQTVRYHKPEKRSIFQKEQKERRCKLCLLMLKKVSVHTHAIELKRVKS